MKPPTPKQQKLIDGLIANAKDPKKTKTLKQIALEAGYSENSAKMPSVLINGAAVRSKTEQFVEHLERLRYKAIQQIGKKIEDAPVNHLTDLMDKSTKNIQLLSGRATQNVAIQINISEKIAQKNQ